MDENLLKEINFIANSKGTDPFIRGRLKSLYKAVKKQNEELEALRDQWKAEDKELPTVVAKAGRIFGVFVALALYFTLLYFIIRLLHNYFFG